MPHPTLLVPAETVVLVVDVQEKLMAKIPAADALVRNLTFLLDAARLLDIETAATEQYPKGLGPTLPALAERLPTRPDKTAFSCGGVPGLLEGFQARGRSRVVLAGIETHVCILHTALDLLAAGLRVYLPVDAVASRSAVDHATALRRLEQAGAIPTTVETIAFEAMGGATHSRFKAISALVQDRMKGLSIG